MSTSKNTKSAARKGRHPILLLDQAKRLQKRYIDGIRTDIAAVSRENLYMSPPPSGNAPTHLYHIEGDQVVTELVSEKLGVSTSFLPDLRSRLDTINIRMYTTTKGICFVMQGEVVDSAVSALLANNPGVTLRRTELQG